MRKLQPNYRKIYTDIILKKHPEKLNICSPVLQKKTLSTLDIIRLNQMVFGLKEKGTFQFNQKHRSYDQSAILDILEYQEKNGLNNTQLANHFKLSRNSVAKWKKIFALNH